MLVIKKIHFSKLRRETVAKIAFYGYRANDKNATWFIAYWDKIYAGFCGFFVLGDTTCYIGPTDVKEEFRGRGIQTALIQHRLEYASLLNLRGVWSRTDCDNLTSANNLIRAGFRLARPKICGITDDGRFSVTLDGSEYLSADKNELFFYKDLP